ncbi:MAG: tetratricopeptide repeat protein [Candidatus Eisenbacteria bacterium]
MRRLDDTRRAPRLDALLVLLAAAGTGLANWFFLRDVPFLDHPIIDAAEYLAEARAIVAGLPYWEAPPIHGPLYPLFLAPFVRFFSSPLPAVYAAQIVLAAGAALLVRSAGVRLGGRLFGNVAALGLAAAPPVLYFEVQALPVVLQVFLHALLVRILVCRREGKCAPLLAAGFAGGLSYLAHPGSGLALLLIGVFLLVKERPARPALLFLFGLLLPLLPVSVLNARAGEGFLPVTGNAGLNLYVGNGPESDGTAHVRPGYEWERLTALPLREGREGSAAESLFFVERTIDAIRSDPGPFLRRLAAKALLFGSAFPIDASQDAAYFRERSPLLRFSVLDAGVLVPLAFGFLLAGAARGRAWTLAALGFAGYWIAAALTVFAVRYRAPVWPFLVLLAPALTPIGPRLARSEALRGALGAVLLLLVAQSDPFGYRGVNPVRTEYNLARLAYERGDRGEARARFRSIWSRTGDPDAANGLGVVGMAEPDEAPRALEWFDEALRARPDYADARFNRALLLLRLGRGTEAEEELDEAVRLSPGHAPALYTKGILLDRDGKGAEAEGFYREALRRDPTRDDAWNALGVLLARSGRAEEADACFRRALRLDPSSVEARENLSRLGSGADGALRFPAR